MPIDAKHEDLQNLRIDRSAKSGDSPTWARRYIVIGITLVALLSVGALAYRAFAPDVPHSVERARDVGSILADGGRYLAGVGLPALQ